MDWNRIEGNWKQFKGQAKEKWGRLTDDDLDVINGQLQRSWKSASDWKSTATCRLSSDQNASC